MTYIAQHIAPTKVHNKFLLLSVNTRATLACFAGDNSMRNELFWYNIRKRPLQRTYKFSLYKASLVYKEGDHSKKFVVRKRANESLTF